MLPIGSIAPDFQAVDQHGQAVSLDSLLSRGRLVLYFYPRDFTSVCTAEACMFRDAAAELAEKGLNVAGVSHDDTETHARFASEHQLTFPLIADPEQEIARLYDARRALIGSTKRITYVIDSNRTILAASHHELSATKHLTDIRALLAKPSEAPSEPS